MHDKGVDDYIQAAIRIREKYPNTEFNMLGFIEPTEMHYEKELKELQDKGIVLYRGSQNDVKPFIARAHATIHPSTYGEGMSNVLLESASSGRFLISTNNPGCQETIEDNITGFIYQGGNVDALVSASERFLAMSNAQRKEAGEKGRERMLNHFSRRIVIKEYNDSIKNILS
jgi:galacturonosyltransferase